MDFLFFETGDGGDMSYNNGDVKLDKSLFTSVYLAHFGGNKDVMEKNDNSINTKRAWWGNLFTRDKEQLKLTSYLETALRNTALNSLAPEKLKIAAEKDLAYLVEANLLSEFEVNITIESNIHVRIQETLIEPTGRQTNLSLLWDNTKQVVISNYALPAATKQGLKITNWSGGEIVNIRYLPIKWTNNNVYAVNVGYIKDGVKTVVESNIVGTNETILAITGAPISDFKVFVENADFNDVRNEVELFSPVYMSWLTPIEGTIFDPRDTITFEAFLNTLSQGYTSYSLDYLLYTYGTKTVIDSGNIGTYAFGGPDTFVFRDESSLTGDLELIASIPGTDIINKIKIIIGF